MMSLLALVLSSSWSSLGKTTINVIARVQLAQEIDFTTAALCRDLGGCLTDKTPADQIDAAFPFANWTCDTSDSDNHILKISVGDTAGHIIIYRRDTENENLWLRNNLVRIYADSTEKEESRFTVAKNVDKMTLDLGTGTLKIMVEFSCNYHPDNPEASTARSAPLIKRTCVLVASKPESKATI